MLVIGNRATAETVTARVVGISDGNTITVLVERQQVKVRINGIDAPENRQLRDNPGRTSATC